MKANVQSAFTLIEVVIATFIVGLSLVALAGTVQAITHQTSQLQETFIANLVANNILDEMQLLPGFPDSDEISENTEMANQTWYYEVKVFETDVPELRRVEVSVGLDESLEKLSAYLVGFISANSRIPQNSLDWVNQNQIPGNPGTNPNNNPINNPGS